MLIKMETNRLKVNKGSMTPMANSFVRDYIYKKEFLTNETDVDIIFSATETELYRFLFETTKKFDVELM